MSRTAQEVSELLKEMERTPESGVKMCHEQGKTAVYLSKDGKYIVEHPPHGAITRTLLAHRSARER